jgi:Family of unknown function (DUF6076)
VSERAEQAEATLDLVGGSRWLRSSGYYIENGLIRLRPGAELEIYDPWEAWRTAADEDRPYKRLLRLAQQLHPPRLNGPLPQRQQRQLETWVQENGLLGILPHETIEAHFAPRWVHERRETRDMPPSSDDELILVAEQRHQLPFEEGAYVQRRHVGKVRSSDRTLEGQLVDLERLAGAERPIEALCRRLPEGKLERRTIGEHYHEFFPDVPGTAAHTFAYPGFDTDEFWRGYAESTWRLIHVAAYLAAPLNALDRLQHATLSDEDEMMIQRALHRIGSIAAVADMWGALGEDDQLTVGWASPSLLGMYALMLLSDLKAGHAVKRCPNCETLFLAKNLRAIYCSSTCRHAQQKREWRKSVAERKASGG